MNNSDFQRLLTTNDRELVSELTKRKTGNKKKGKGGAGKGGEDSEKGKGKKGSVKGKGKGEPKKGERPTGGQPAGNENEYRDRAKERREQKGEYETVANEFENHAEVAVDQSKYLGGDLEHTHLVKGLDFALLSKVRGELNKQQKVDELQQQRAERKQQKKRSFETVVARRVWNTVVETLHPHHSTFRERVGRMGKAISMGQRIRGAPTTFLQGRMNYEFDTDASQSSADIPRIIYMSKEDAPKVDFSKKAASVLPETVSRMRDALQRASDRKKQARKDKTAGATVSFTVAQKVVPKYKARDKDDIFQGAGGFDTTQVVKESKLTESQKADKKPSYFDDAGSEKFLQAPDGQIELDDVEVDEKDDEGAATAAADPKEFAFDPSESFKGARPGWVFKLGDKGLGYYCEDRGAAAGKRPAPRDTRRQPPRPAKKASGQKGVPAADEDAYGELFPSAMMGNAAVGTGEQGDSDAEDEKEETEKKIKRLQKLAKSGKKGGPEGDSLAANQKAEAKKRKMSEQQEWQKIDKIIKKGNFKSVEELEASANRQRRSGAPTPREIMATPAFF